MKQNRLYLLQEFLVQQINNLIFYPIALTIVTLCSGFIPPIRASLTLWMLFGTIMLALYFVRCYVSPNFFFIGIHFAFIGVIFLFIHLGKLIPLEIFYPLNNSVNRLVIMIAAIRFVVYSFTLRFHNRTESDIVPMPLTIGFIAVAMYLQQYKGNQEWNVYYQLTLIIIFAFYFIRYYVKEYLTFLIVNESSTGVLPAKEIFNSGFRFTLMYTLFGVLVLFTTAQFSWLKSILGIISNFFAKILIFILNFFSSIETPYTPSEMIVTENTTNNGKFVLPEANETALIWKILEVITVIAVFLGILFLLFKVITVIIAAMTKNVKTHEKELTEICDVREKCKSIRSPKNSPQPLSFLGFLDAKERIRRIYKKKVTAYRPLPLNTKEAKSKKCFSPKQLRYYTAKEMELEMKAEPFAAIYDKARYSNEECTNQDVKHMKELCH